MFAGYYVLVTVDCVPWTVGCVPCCLLHWGQTGLGQTPLAVTLDSVWVRKTGFSNEQGPWQPSVYRLIRSVKGWLLYCDVVGRHHCGFPQICLDVKTTYNGRPTPCLRRPCPGTNAPCGNFLAVAFTKPPIFQKNMPTGSGNPTFD